MMSRQPAAALAERRRRGLTITVLVCAAASAVALYAASRVWGEVSVVRPAPLPSVEQRRTGSNLEPWLPGLALVGLAGAGALIATRGALRIAVGVLMVACGFGIVAGGLMPLTGDCDLLWPVVSAVSGTSVAAGGVLTVRRGRFWPAMGARYERPAAEPQKPPTAPRSQAELWDALDRGEDPTSHP